MLWRLECKQSGKGHGVQCGFDEALRRAQAECSSEWSCWVLWLLPSNIRMAEVRQSGVSWSKSSLSGIEVKALMRRHRKTIEELSFRMGITQKRLREVREKGLHDVYALRDWLEAVTGEDVGPLPERYYIRHWTEEGSCRECGYPMDVGEHAFLYLSDIFCSVACCRLSRGWGREKVV